MNRACKTTGRKATHTSTLAGKVGSLGGWA